MVAIHGASPSGRWPVVGREIAFPPVPGRLFAPEVCLDLGAVRDVVVALVFLAPAVDAVLVGALVLTGDFTDCFMDDPLADDELLREWPSFFPSRISSRRT